MGKKKLENLVYLLRNQLKYYIQVNNGLRYNLAQSQQNIIDTVQSLNNAGLLRVPANSTVLVFQDPSLKMRLVWCTNVLVERETQSINTWMNALSLVDTDETKITVTVVDINDLPKSKSVVDSVFIPHSVRPDVCALLTFNTHTSTTDLVVFKDRPVLIFEVDSTF